MWSHVVVVDLIALQDRGVRSLEATHDLFSITDFPVQPFHLVVVLFTREGDLAYVVCSRCDAVCLVLSSSSVGLFSG